MNYTGWVCGISEGSHFYACLLCIYLLFLLVRFHRLHLLKHSLHRIFHVIHAFLHIPDCITVHSHTAPTLIAVPALSVTHMPPILMVITMAHTLPVASVSLLPILISVAHTLPVPHVLVWRCAVARLTSIITRRVS